MTALRADIGRVLGAWIAPDSTQEQLRLDYLAYLAANPDAATRSCAPDHVTASALVVDADFENVVLVLHPKFGRWLQPGGHCEPGDVTLVDAARREATEETGIGDLICDPTPLLLSRHAVRCWPDGHHLDVQFLAIAPNGAELVCSDESDEVRWMSFAEAAEKSDDSVRALLEAASQRHREIPSPKTCEDNVPPVR